MANTFPCPSCKNKLAFNVKACPKCGHEFSDGEVEKITKKQNKIGIIPGIILSFFIIFVIVQCSSNESGAPKTAAKTAEDKRKGFHCLSVLNGAHSRLERHLEKSLKDPDSYDHIETRITPVNATGSHTLFMKYRAKNGFGALDFGSITALINNETCNFEIIASD